MSKNKDYEELLVYAEFDSSVDITSFNSAHLLGVDSSNPIIQMDDTFFKGKYEMPVGTFMFFQEDSTPECEDAVFYKLPEKLLQYLCKSSKYLKMEQAYIAPKDGSAPATSDQSVKDIKPIIFNSAETALAKFREEWKRNGEDDKSSSTVDDNESTCHKETPMQVDVIDSRNSSDDRSSVRSDLNR